MEVSPTELMNILNKIISKREFFQQIFYDTNESLCKIF